MKTKLIRSYRSQKGNVVFVYAVSGSKEALEAYKQAQGDNYREDEDGTPLWFTTRCIGKTGELLITTKGKVVPDTSAFDMAQSMAAQYGGNLGQELAKQAVLTLLGGTTSAPVMQEATDGPMDQL